MTAKDRWKTRRLTIAHLHGFALRTTTIKLLSVAIPIEKKWACRYLRDSVIVVGGLSVLAEGDHLEGVFECVSNT